MFFAYRYICSEKSVFVSIYLICPVSYWSQLVYDRWRVETCLYLSGIGVASLQSRPRLVTNTRRFAPVVMAIERQCPSVTPAITRSPEVHRRPDTRHTFLPSPKYSWQSLVASLQSWQRRPLTIIRFGNVKFYCHTEAPRNWRNPLLLRSSHDRD